MVMSGRVACVIGLLVSCSLLCACAFVDQFSPRVYQANLNYQDVNSQEALVNIVRASRFEALSFASVTSSSGTQSETLGTGLPTFTLGPGQTVAQHQFVFGGNSVSSVASGTFQANPLVTSNFIQGMLTPINTKVLALLLGTYPRAWVLYATLDGIKLTGTVKRTGEKIAVYFRNDPLDDQYNGVYTSDQCPALVEHKDFTSPLYRSDRLCNFSKFNALLQEALDFGLSFEIDVPGASGQAKGGGGAQGAKPAQKAQAAPATQSTPGGSSQPGATTNTTSTPNSTGHICWDPTLATAQLKPLVLGGGMTNVCGTPASPEYAFDFGSVLITDAQFVFRSPYGVYEYLGSLLREQSAGRIGLNRQNLMTLKEYNLASGPFLNIVPGNIGDCLVEAFYNGQSYCVPRKGSASTAIMLDILGQLKNLSTTPSDLNAAFAVRVVD